MTEFVKGFCPTQNCEYTICVKYNLVSNNQYLKCGADCDYCSTDETKCPIMLECPIRSSAPKIKYGF